MKFIPQLPDYSKYSDPSKRPDPQNYCSRCGEEFWHNQLEEYGDELLCRECLEIVLEEEKNDD